MQIHQICAYCSRRRHTQLTAPNGGYAHTDTTDGATPRDCLTAPAHSLRQDHPELAHTRAAADVQVPCGGRDG